MRISKVSVVVFFALLAVLSVGVLVAQHAEIPVTGDVYKAGGTVILSNDVDGDVIVAGGSVTIGHSVSEDVIAAGGNLTITADVDDDIRAAGGRVTISGDVGDDLIVAAYSISLEPGTSVGGRAWLSAQTITVEGNVNSGLVASGGDVVLAGTIAGDVEIDAESFEVEPGTVIKGNLTYSATSEAVVADDAVIEGEVIRQEFSLGDPDTWLDEFTGSLKFYLSLALCAIVIFLVYPFGSVNVVNALGEAPIKSLGLGFTVLVMTPVLAILLLFSVLGVPLGLIALTVYLATLVAGLLIGIIWIGDAGFRLFGQMPQRSKWVRVGSIFAAAAVLMVIDFIPYVGGWTFFGVLLVGIGAMKLYFYRLYVGRQS